jgi:uncharacterized protein (TIRG00374 family)
MRVNWRSLQLPLRILISGGLLFFLLSRADLAGIWNSWRQANFSLVLLAIALQFFGVVVSTAKWWVLLKARGQNQSFMWLLGAYLVGQFANNFLPTTVGGDALRITQLGRRINSYSQSAASVFLERLTGFLALSLLAILALVLSHFEIAGEKVVTSLWLQLLTVGFALIAFGGMVFSFIAPQLEARFGKWIPKFAQRPLNKFTTALAEYAPQGIWLFWVMALSVLFQLSWIVLHWVSGVALGIDAPFLLYALMAPITDIVGLAPIFLNNLGAREMVFTVYLSQLSVATEQILALSFLIFGVRLVVSILGGLVMLFGGADLGTKAEPESEQAA